MASMFEKLRDKGSFDFYAPKTILVRDARLGIGSALLQLGVLLFLVIWGLTTNPVSFMHTAIPTGNARFFGNADPVIFAAAQSKTEAHCNNPSFSWGDQFCLGTSQDKNCDSAETCDGIFCEFNIGCAAMSFSEINLKGENEMSFLTIVKDFNRLMGPCSLVDEAYCASKHMWFSHATDDICSCHSMQNIYTEGIEDIDLAFSHEMTVSDPMITTALSKSGANLINVKSILQTCDNYGANCEKFAEVPAGGSVRKSIRDWLIMVGIGDDGLNELNEAASLGRERIQPSMNLVYRTTGVKISLKFDYRGHDGPTSYGDPTSPDGIVCYITATKTGGWHSFGSDVAYTDRQDYSLGNDFPKYNNETGEISLVNYHDRYNRGIRFTFEFTGLLAVVDAAAILNYIVALTVFVGLAPALVKYVAYNLLGTKSHIYKDATLTPLTPKRTMAKMIAQSLVAAEVFEQMDTAKSGKLSETELLRRIEGLARSGTFKSEEGVKLLNALLHGVFEMRRVQSAQSDTDQDQQILTGNEIGLSEWVDLVSEDLGTFVSMIKGLDDDGLLKMSALEKCVEGNNTARVTPVTADAAAGMKRQDNRKDSALSQLEAAKDQGIITIEEFESTKRALLNGAP